MYGHLSLHLVQILHVSICLQPLWCLNGNTARAGGDVK